ncbi:acyltransferase [Allosphingosinicella indica]|uniref:Maltose O-acetyltransferase n=1 Tax=Allosphingosinicella indica TaxID=941907 RepID=A0A1X7G147_9SPHN|nr:acyltransferase [Allosphingosinicella indica]SMF62172.1 maltose O-acetyltransferase [Allosphingosinicella indica]
MSQPRQRHLNFGRKILNKLLVRLYRGTIRIESERFMPVRRMIIDALLGRAHRHLFVFPDVFIEGFEGLEIGDHVSINRSGNLSASGGLKIGDNVAIGHRVSIVTTNHGFRDEKVPIKYQPVESKAVSIGANVWIGANVTILAGISIAPGSVIAAGAVVTKSITEPNLIVGGNPARTIRGRLE